MSQYQFTPLTGVLLLTICLALYVARTAWQRRSVPGAIYLALAQLAVAHWATSYIFEAAAVNVELKTFWYAMSYPGIVCTSPLFFLFASAFSQETSFVSVKKALLLFIVPTLIVIAVWTNGWHSLYWRDVYINPLVNVEVYVRGPLFWVSASYSYLLISAGIIRLYLASIRFSKFHQRQTKALLLAFSLPFAADIFCMSRFNPLPGLDWTVMAFSLSGIILLWSLFRRSVFQSVPMARDLLMDMVEEGVLLLDVQNRVADINPPLMRCLNKPLQDVISHPMTEVFTGWEEFIVFLQDQSRTEANVRVIEDAREVFYHVRQTPMHDKHRRPIGNLVFVRDITRSKILEQEKARLAEGLQDALAYVKTLSGLLPICAQCKQIRDEHGQWHPVEIYVRDRTDAEFSHGICPECARQLYPDELDDLD